MKQEILQLTGGNFTDSRRELDYYPTPSDVTKALMTFLNNIGLKKLSILEPACVNGAMSEIIKLYGHDVDSSDIRETGYGIPGIDFLSIVGQNKYDAIITNPPFSFAEQFIRKAVSESRISAMLLKSQYWHAKSRYNLFIQHPPAYVLPLTWRPDFLEHTRKPGDKKGAPTMEVAWSVWIDGDANTKYKPLIKPI